MIDEIETAFDPIEAKLHAIDPPVDARESLLGVGHGNLQLPDVFAHLGDVGVDSPKHHQNETVGFNGHDAFAIAAYSAAIKVAPGWLARRVR